MKGCERLRSRSLFLPPIVTIEKWKGRLLSIFIDPPFLLVDLGIDFFSNFSVRYSEGVAEKLEGCISLKENRNDI